MRKLLFFVCLSLTSMQAQNNYTQYVNPFIGTGGHGHTFPGATLPFAMVQLSPDTRIDGSWDGCSGYHHSDSIIYGFSHTHLSGTGCSDYGDIAFMPSAERGGTYFLKDTVYNHRAAGFSHKDEIALAGFYQVKLDNGIKVELTSTTRVGFQRYTFDVINGGWITLDLGHRDQLLEGKITQNNPTSFSGYRRSKAWAEDQLVYFYFEVNKVPMETRMVKNAKGDIELHMRFAPKMPGQVLIKTSLSSVDENGAMANMQTELPHWDFEKVKNDANAAWNKELNRIKVYGGTKEEKINFYTALYHCMIHPNVMNDVDGRYRGRDKQVHKAEGFDYYTVFSLWDTHRALHPLLNIIDKKRSHDFIMTFKAQYEQSGRLPMWELWGNETNCMIGFHSVSVILDAYVNGVISLEELRAIYPAVKAEAMSNRFGLDKFREKGYLEVEDESESVSKTLEYSYDMWCVSQMAKYLDTTKYRVAKHIDTTKYRYIKDEKYFGKLSSGSRSMRDVSSGFIRPRKNGGWFEPFDPRQVNNHFTEANAWQYSFYSSGRDSKLLDSLFKADSRTTGREQSDITGLIGQYAHGNEPSHSFIYYLEEQGRKFYLKKVMKDFYLNRPDGLCGNEDCGQMSAWYVFSALGFYPVLPGHVQYKRGISLFDSFFFDNKKEVSSRIVDRITFKFYGDDYLPIYYSAPVIQANKMVFNDSLLIQIYSNNEKLDGYDYVVYYSVNGGELKKYTEPFYIYNNSRISARIELLEKKKNRLVDREGYITDISTAHFYKRPNNYSIKLNSTYNKQYTADGDEGLIDGLIGDVDWRKGRWQGYQGQDFEAVIDLQKEINVNSINAGFLQDTRSWILFPSQVVFYGSIDGVNFEEIRSVKNEIADTSMTTQRLEFGINNIQKKYRYIKVKALNYGKLPAWHPGRGEDAFIFIDEISIN